MSMTIKQAYAPIDIHKGEGWPADVPAMTEAIAQTAFKRLWRWATGIAYPGKIEFTTGNRRALRMTWWSGSRLAVINPSKGWQDFAHDFSHWVWYIINQDNKHSKEHARFERNVVKQIIKRGWLVDKPTAIERGIAAHEDMLHADELALTFATVNPKRVEITTKLNNLAARLARWQTKAKRADTAMRKIAKEQKRLTTRLAKLV